MVVRPKINFADNFPIHRANLNASNNEKGSNSSFEMLENVYNSMRFPLISPPSIPTTLSTPESLTNKIEAIVKQYFSAITLGACLGAAITTGLIVGIYACSNFISILGFSNEKPWYTHLFFRNNHRSNSKENEINIFLSVPNPQLQDNFQSSEEQCRECIQNLALYLVSNNKTWHHVRKITVFLCVEKCSSQIFRKVWNDHMESKRKIEAERIVLIIVFVQRHEVENAVVQLEALVC